MLVLHGAPNMHLTALRVSLHTEWLLATHLNSALNMKQDAGQHTHILEQSVANGSLHMSACRRETVHIWVFGHEFNDLQRRRCMPNEVTPTRGTTYMHPNQHGMPSLSAAHNQTIRCACAFDQQRAALHAFFDGLFGRWAHIREPE